MVEPKFKIGDKVTHEPDLYGMTESTVYEIQKLFQEVDADGKFERRGLSHLESTIGSIAIPYEFDGETLTIHYPADRFENAFTKVSKFRAILRGKCIGNALFTNSAKS